jgi:predicted dehydrogenase
VRKQRTPLVSGKESVDVMHVMDAMYESATSGREVELDG